MMSAPCSAFRIPLQWLPAVALAALVSACGGGDPGAGSAATAGAGNPTAAAASIATGTTVFVPDAPPLPEAVANTTVEPTFHVAPVVPAPPGDIDANGTSASALLPPVVSVVPETLRSLPSRSLAPDRLLQAAAQVAPAASGTPGPTVVTYRPAQIRAAYGLPPVPSSLTGLTALQLAQFGAGQTIYVIDAMDDPMAFGELSAHSELFGLPMCNQQKLAANASLPLPAPSARSCDFYQVYATTAGGMTATAPAYDAKWAMEVALDVQWAHAIAPLARIVLVEAPAATTAGITGAIQLANQMGAGSVSMSFTTPEGPFVGALDSNFRTNGMSYFGSTGDSGSGVGWPSVSPYVVAVGGTSLNYTGTGTRTETAWSLTGGGVSAYVAAPSWQAASVPGLGAAAHRNVADVSFNADPNTGQFVAVIANQNTCSFCVVSWLTAGGTSLATPQWAALNAVANALRASAGKAPIGDPHAVLYTQLAAVNANYLTDWYDVTAGSDGSCAACGAHKGYDDPTGLGTPNGLAMVEALAGATVPSTPPVVVGATINGTYNQTLNFTASVSDANPYTLSLSGAPAGMIISGNGVVTWPVPLPGNYSVTVIAKDSRNGLSGQGVYQLAIAGPPPPMVSSGAIDATVGTALSLPVVVGDVNRCNLTLTGAPAGLAISATGVLSWAKPVAGSYRITITAKDPQTNLVGQGVYTVAVSPAGAPAVQSGSVTARPGGALAFTVTTTDTNPVGWSLSGAPAGMSINASGSVQWSNPVAGSYTFTVSAKDTKSGLTGIGMYVLNVGTSTGPAVTASLMTGVAGKAFTGTITISDASASLAGVGIGGGPNGMSFSPQGGGFSAFQASWPTPVAGTYVLQVSATDSAGNSAITVIPVVISAH